MNPSPQQKTSWLPTDGWARFPGLVHGFSRRISDRDAALALLDTNDLTVHTLRQVHGDHIITVDRSSSPDERLEADGLITTQAGVLLGIATADCVPVLMVEPQQGVAVALHAGWKGTLKGIVRRAVELLETQWNVDPRNLHVALGPSIGGCCYEVGPEVGEAIVERWNISDTSAWRPVGTKGFLDLRAVNVAQLMAAGVQTAHLARTGPCTFCDPAFASYRREGARAGRQLSVIGWRKAS